MKKVRHQVEKINPGFAPSFDQQFWPVLIAIIVLGSIASGAIVTLIKGPWMWGSLLILPAAAGMTILLLYRLDDSILRRSLQIAILGSLAIHLLILVGSSLTFIFGNSIEQPDIVVAKTPQRKILVTNKAKQFVFQKPTEHKIEDERKVQPEKKQTTVTTKPQTVPVEKQETPVEQQSVKRKTVQQSVPKLEKSLSKRSRSTRSKPNVASSINTTQSAASSTSRKAESTSQSATAAPTETKLTKQSQAESSRSSSAKQKITASDANKSHNLKMKASRRTTKAASIAEQANSPTARIRKSTPRIPNVARKSSTRPTVSEATNPQTRNKLSKSASSHSKIQRQQSEQTVATKSNVAKPSQTTPTQVTQSRSQKRTTTNNENLRGPSASAMTRRSANKSPTAPTSNPNSQVVQPTASTADNNPPPSPKQVAITRSTNGMIGTSRSKNLERAEGGQPSPTNLASNSASKRNSNRVSENIAMSSSQKSNAMERGRAERSLRVLRSQTSKWAKQSGSSNPAETTTQAASASIDSATAQTNQRSAAEKGTSMLDLGSTKVVPEITADRRGGGGQPDLSNAITRTNRPAGGRMSNQLPNISPAQSSATQGEYSPSESLQAADANHQPDGQITKASPANSNAATKGTFESESDELSGMPNATRNLIANQSRNGESQESQDARFSADMTGESEMKGNARTRIANAPNIERQLNFGNDGRQNAQVTESSNEGHENSTAKMVRRATDTISGGSMFGTASKMVASSLAGMPVFGQGAGNGKRRNNDQSLAVESTAKKSNSRSRSDTSPKINGQIAATIDAANEGSEATTKNTDLSGSSFELAKTEAGQSLGKQSVELKLDETDGTGGLGDELDRRVGKITDAIKDSENISPNSDVRFKRKEFGGLPSVTPNAIVAKEAFRSRNPTALGDSGPRTEKAIEMGLEFLASCQLADGSWTLGQFDNEDPLFQNQLNSDAAATGLALLAFQGAGYNHREFKYASQVKSAIDWLVANQEASGCLFVKSDKASNDSSLMYSHAIAALALTEAYGMTQDPTLRLPTQRALDYISSTQDPRKGGWRYFAQIRLRSSDTSVTGWMMMALKSGKLAGLNTNKTTMDKIEAWLRVAEVPNSKSEFRYNPYAVDSEGKSRTHGRQASTTMTAVGLLMRVYTGWGPQDSRFLQGTDFLLKQLPGDKDSRTRDTYYWYYATQVMKHAGGDRWEQWKSALHPLLVGTQESSGPMRGSWHPYKPVPDRWAPQGGRIYVTTMNLLSLEVKYRLLPLYENTIK